MSEHDLPARKEVAVITAIFTGGRTNNITKLMGVQVMEAGR